MRKLCSKWVLCLLTVNQKQQHFGDSEGCLQLFQSNKKEILHKYVTMKHGSTTSLQSLISSQLSGQQHVKAIQSDQRDKHQQARFWLPYFGILKAFCSSITLRKEEPSIANIIKYCWCVWRKKLPKNSHKWRRKKCSFNKTMHRVTSQSQWWLNYMNCISNCFRTHPIFQIWPPANLKRMLQGKRFGSNEEVILETEVYFEAKDKSFNKKGIELLEKHWNQCITLEGDYVNE